MFECKKLKFLEIKVLTYKMCLTGKSARKVVLHGQAFVAISSMKYWNKIARNIFMSAIPCKIF